MDKIGINFSLFHRLASYPSVTEYLLFSIGFTWYLITLIMWLYTWIYTNVYHLIDLWFHWFILLHAYHIVTVTVFLYQVLAYSGPQTKCSLPPSLFIKFYWKATMLMYVLFMGALELQWLSSGNRSRRLRQTKIFMIWPFAEGL